MQYSDDDVSVSGSEDDHQHDGVSEEEFDDDEHISFSEDSEDAAADPTADPAAAAATAAAAAAGALTATGKPSTRDVTDALMSGEVSTQTALLQMEVSYCTPAVTTYNCLVFSTSATLTTASGALCCQHQHKCITYIILVASRCFSAAACSCLSC
jgi:hypothetical protein